ncbi:MAG: tetratricopeptide repeat protein [Gemmataceae bacterium]|nr:tetratricopeptide repeat protein [Gemmataceae bacterium]
MAGAESAVDPVAELAEEFMARYRRGERPALSEYTQKHPALAERIRQVFPMMVLMEEAAPAEEKCDRATVIDLSTGVLNTLEKPKMLGGYRILRELGRGGMGIVYEAEQVALGRHVALKVVPLGASKDSARLERFRREARAAARLHHTNIVPVHEVGEEGDFCFYAMQYIRGQPLDQVLEELQALRQANAAPATPGMTATDRSDRRAVAHSLWTRCAPTVVAGPNEGNQQETTAFSVYAPHSAQGQAEQEGLPDVCGPGPETSSILHTGPALYHRNVAHIGVQVANALAYAHREGVVHRDIKPSNLLLDGEGRVWVTDFGLAKTDAEPLTGTGDILGTLRYMPPERFRGWSDPRSDVYSLGLTLYEMLLLQPAFAETDQAKLIHLITSVEPTRLRKVDRQIPRDLATIVTKAIDKEPTRRYQVADELAADLQRFLEDRPIQARQTGVTERTWRWCRRNPAVAALLASLTVVLSLVFWQWRRAEDNAVAAQANAGKAQQNFEREREARRRSLIDEARGWSYSRQPGQRDKGMEAVRQAVPLGASPELRDLAIRLSGLTDIRLGPEWDGYPAGTHFIIFDSNLECYARGNDEGQVSVHSVPDDQPLVSLPAPSGDVRELRVTFMRFSPDGRYLAVVYGDWSRVLHVWDLSRRKSVWQRPNTSNGIAFTIDSRQLVIADEDGSVGVFDSATGIRVRDLGKAPGPTRVVASPNGKWLAIARHHHGAVEICDLATGTQRKRLKHPPSVHDVAWHPHDEDLLATSAQQIYLWDLRSPDKPMSTLPGHAGPTTNITFSHRGDILASKAWAGDSTMRLWDPWTGRQLVQIVGAGDNSEMPIQFSPDDRRLAFAHNGTKIGLWEIERAREFRSLQGNATLTEGVYASIDRHPRLPLLAAGTRSGPRNGIRLWNLDTGRMLDFLPVGETFAVCFHASGEALFTGHEGGPYAWPIVAREAAGAWHIGPPRRFATSSRTSHISLSKKTQRMAVTPASGEAIVIDLPERPYLPLPEVPKWLPGRSVLSPLADRLSRRVTLSSGYITVLSPDGRWAVGAGALNAPIPVLNAQTGKQVRTLSAGSGWSSAEFSPDGRWLLVGSLRGYQLYDVGSLAPDAWRLHYEQPRNVGGDSGAFAWSPDSRVFAVMRAGSVVRLTEAETGRELANLEPPDPDWAVPQRLRFSADGSLLIVATVEMRMIHVWDLRLIGERLAELGLPWDLPASETAPAVPDKPLQVRVNLGPFAGREPRQKSREHMRAGAWQKAVDEANRAIEQFKEDAETWRLRAQARLALKQFDQAIADYEHSLKLGPPDAVTDNNLAWYVVAFPDSPADLLPRARTWAKNAVALAPNEGSYWNTLGVAHYRAGDWDEAIKALQQALKLSRGREYAHDAFFLAMAHWKRGEKNTALSWQRKATSWMDKHAPDNKELRRFRNETLACARQALDLELEKASRAIEDKPDSAEAHYQRGMVYYDLEQFAQARDDFSRALTVDPEHVGAYHYRGHAQQFLKHYTLAIDDLTQAIKRQPKNAHFYDCRAQCYYAIKQPELAARDWERCLDLNPKQPNAAVCHSLAWLYVTGPEAVRNPQRALSLARQADQQQPGTYSYLTGLAVAHYRLDQFDRAVESLTRAAAARKDGPTATSLFFLAMCRHRLGDAVGARADYDRALAWWQTQRGLSEHRLEQLVAFREEAEAVLQSKPARK